MPIPLMWVVGVVAAGAVKKGVDAGMLLKQAKDLHQAALKCKDDAEQEFQLHLEDVHLQGTTLQQQKEAVMAGSVARFVELWERQKKKANITDKDFALHLNITPEKMEEFKGMGVKSLDLARGLGTAAVAGAVTGYGVTSAVTTFGMASTGAAISGLSGAAANSALLAWLGGGTLAAGGGGVALGAIVASGLFIAPAALAGTFFAAKKGQEALTAATKYAADVEVYEAQLEAKRTDLTAIQSRMAEVERLVGELVARLRKSLAECEADEAERDGVVRTEQFYQAASLTKTLCDLMSVPIIDEDIRASLASGTAVLQAQRSLLN